MIGRMINTSKTYQTTISNLKLTLPPQVRARFSDSLYISRGLPLEERQTVLSLYTLQEWQKFRQILDELPRDVKGTRQVRRFFVAGAYEIEIVNNSILLPEHLLNYIHIDTEPEDRELTFPVNIYYNPDADKYHRKCILWRNEKV